MKCPFAVETIFNEDYKPSYQQMMVCDEKCALRVMTGDGEFMCAFQCAQNSLHAAAINLERIACQMMPNTETNDRAPVEPCEYCNGDGKIPPENRLADSPPGTLGIRLNYCPFCGREFDQGTVDDD